MVPDQPKPEEAIFKAAIQLEAPGPRRAYVLEACGSDRQLLAGVETLLQYHDSRSFLDAPALDPEVRLEEPVVTEGPGTVLGPTAPLRVGGRYKLLEKIGEGGMAVVYMAEQTEPIRRKVALKIIKLGMDTRQVIARFEAERQALALMDHPSIAKVLDAGATETGRPYFVMELVQGVSITEYCDTNSLSTKERLGLFLQVCQAVQHAHQKGIIHRDIKPSNVMVTHHDGRPIPKVIDFGIAKATNRKLTEKTLFTRYAHLIGTPAYMSPEQAQLCDLDIDTRSDIYSLGVLLYELLTGTTPFSEEELRKAGYLEMQRVIREQEPVKPSTKLSTLGDTLTDIAKCRNSTPDLLRKAIRGDLDWIVMKSLEKDRARRYETANGLAEDVRRHLEHEPVLARGPGATYRLQKFLRRHRVLVLASLTVAVVAAAGVVVLSLWNRDRAQLAEAKGFQHEGILSQARGQHAQGDRQAALKSLVPILHSEQVGVQARLLYAGILVEGRLPDEAAAMLMQLLEERPAIAGAAHALLARLLWESQSPGGEKGKEIEEHRRQAEALLPQTAEAYFLRAMTAITVKEQLASLNQSLELDGGHYESHRLRAFLYYASRKYEQMEHDALALTVLRPRDPLGYSLRAIAWRELGRYPEALQDYDRAVARTPPDTPACLDLVTQRCETLLRMEDYPRAVAEARACLESWPDKTIFQYDLFAALTALGDYDAATTLFRQIVRSGPASHGRFEDWCAKYVFDTLAAGRSWHQGGRAPAGVPFLPLVEAEETYRVLSAKARRVVTNGFTAHWSPDGKKLAYSTGVLGCNGVAVFDPATKETDLLIAPGKDPAWSPDGKYIAFARDRPTQRLEEFVLTKRQGEYSPPPQEIWVMKADGTEPRRLAHGRWPSWSPDSTCVYLSEGLSVYSVCLTDLRAAPKRIVTCSSSLPTLSPDGQRVAYVEGGSLKIRDVASGTVVAEWEGPFVGWCFAGWSARGDELCVGGSINLEKRAGLWIHRFDRREPVKILDGQVQVASWSAEGTKLVFTLRLPFWEVWAADLDPNVSLVETLGPARTRDEHSQELIALWTRRIEADPTDANNYLHRGDHYRFLHEDAKLRAEARRYSAAVHPGWPGDFCLDGPWCLMQTVNGPFGYQLVVFWERQEDGMQLLRLACGPKGRWAGKLLEIPMVVTSLLGLCFLPEPQVLTARADFTLGAPQKLGPPVNTSSADMGATSSMDGLELYLASGRSDQYGLWDIYVSTRRSVKDPWGPPQNLGATINTPYHEAWPSLSSDGLTLYFTHVPGRPPRPGWLGAADIWRTTRPSRAAPWGTPVNMGAPINSPDHDVNPCPSRDGLTFFFGSDRPGGSGSFDLWMSTRPTVQDPWGPAVNLGPNVNSGSDDFSPALSADALVLFFCSGRTGGFGDRDVWITTRKSAGAPWAPAVNLGPVVNSAQWEQPSGLSGDMRTLYLTSNRPDGFELYDVWEVPILPTADSNASGGTDSAPEP